MTREEAIKRFENVKANALVQKASGVSEYWQNEIDGTVEAIDMAIEALSADAVQGEWIEYTDCEGKTRTITCSECGWEEHSWIDTNYCPSCGARMKGGAE